MKKSYKLVIVSIILLLLATFNVVAQTSPQEENDFDIGGKMINYPKVDWLRGNPITHFEKDSIYIVELWATWCKPCLAAMPHLIELNKKFKGKIIFIAQNVMEDNKEKVEQLVKTVGSGWDIRVGYAGFEKSDFHKKWILPAGVFTIPQTFVICNNKLVWQTLPGKLNEEILQLLIDGKFTVAAAEAIAAKNNMD